MPKNVYDITDYDKKPRVLSLGKSFLMKLPEAFLSGNRILVPLAAVENRERSDMLYNPFAFYDADFCSTPEGTAILNEYLALRNPKRTSPEKFTGFMYFHTLFASINQLPKPTQNEAVLMWVRHFGIQRQSLLDWAVAKAKKLNMPNAVIPTKYILRDIQLFSHAMNISTTCRQLIDDPYNADIKRQLIDMILFRDTQAPQPILPIDDTSCFFIVALNNGVDPASLSQIQQEYKKLAEPIMSKDPLHFALKTLTALIDCTSFKPSFCYDSASKKTLLNWICEDAITAMWTMLQFDLTSSRYMRRCASSTCNCFFAATRKSGRFCSLLCQTSVGVKNCRTRKAQK